MAYDAALAARIREHLSGTADIVEKEMFGGIAFMFQGNMAVGVSRDELMVRVHKEEHEQAVSQPNVRTFDMSGREMRGWLLISADGVAEDADLHEWIETGLEYAGTLPPK